MGARNAARRQIELTFTCRECGQETTLRTDTSNYGVLGEAHNDNIGRAVPIVNIALAQDLRCEWCHHISGELGLGYRFQEQHKPNHET